MKIISAISQRTGSLVGRRLQRRVRRVTFYRIVPNNIFRSRIRHMWSSLEVSRKNSDRVPRRERIKSPTHILWHLGNIEEERRGCDHVTSRAIRLRRKFHIQLKLGRNFLWLSSRSVTLMRCRQVDRYKSTHPGHITWKSGLWVWEM